MVNPRRQVTRDPVGKTPTRASIRALLQAVAQDDPLGQGGARTVAQIAAHVGIKPAGARQHLDVLVDLDEVQRTGEPIPGQGNARGWRLR